jgi:hypothetical protein
MRVADVRCVYAAGIMFGRSVFKASRGRCEGIELSQDQYLCKPFSTKADHTVVMSRPFTPKFPWTKADEAILLICLRANMELDMIALEFPNRTLEALKKKSTDLRKLNAIPKRPRKQFFTAAEDSTVLKAHDEEGHSFGYISRYMSTRSTTVIHTRYQELKSEGRTRLRGDWEGREWQLEEDDHLRYLLSHYETEMPPWTFFEQDFEDRSGYALVRRATALGWKPSNGKVDLYSTACSWTLQEDITIRSAALAGILDSELLRIGWRCHDLGKTAQEVALRWKFLSSLPEEDAESLAIMQQRNSTEAERFYHNWLEREKRWGIQHSDTPLDNVQVQTSIGEAKEGNLEDLCAPIPPGEYSQALEQSACTTTVSSSSNARRPASSDSEDTSVCPSKALRRLAPAPPTPRL